jgi:hypothetical protein
MTVPIRLPFYEGETGATCKVYSEADALLQSGVALAESTTPGIYTGSINFAGGTYRNVLIYSSGSTLADANWSVAVVTDGVEADYAESIGELRARAANQAEHDATQAAIATLATESNATANTASIVAAIGDLEDARGALVVMPNAVDAPARSTPAADDVLYINESGLFSKQIKDTDGVAVDLTQFSLLFVAEIENGLDKFSTTTVTVGGTGNSFFSVTLPNTMTSKDGRTLVWSLRDRTANKRTVLGSGKIVVDYAADDLSFGAP